MLSLQLYQLYTWHSYYKTALIEFSGDVSLEPIFFFLTARKIPRVLATLEIEEV